MTDPRAVFRVVFSVGEAVIDENRHMNNVAYVQAMQDVAIRHFTALGGLEDMAREGAAWVARSHHIEYLAPARAGDRVELATWVANLRRVRSVRRYQFARAGSGEILACGETEWIFIDRATGRPRAVPDRLQAKFRLLDVDAVPVGATTNGT